MPENEKVIHYTIYHHDDPDGHIAGAIAYHTLIEEGVDPKLIKTYAKDYNDSFNEFFDDYGDPDVNRVVYLVDLSFTPVTFYKLQYILDNADVVYWFDHHASSRALLEDDRLQQYVDKLNVLFTTNMCGAAITYMNYYVLHYFEPKDVDFGEFYQIGENASAINQSHISITIGGGDAYRIAKYVDTPPFLYHLDAYDRWTKTDPEADAFICGLKVLEHGYELNEENLDGIYDDMYFVNDKMLVNKLIENGKIALRYNQYLMYEQRDGIGIWDIDGHIIAYKNAWGQSWNFLNLLDDGTVDAVLIGKYIPGPKAWQYSMYSSNNGRIRCNKVCETFGGGGHPGAAGFSSEVCFFEPEHHWNTQWFKDNYPIAYAAITGKPTNDDTTSSNKPTKIFLGREVSPVGGLIDWRCTIKRYMTKDQYFDPVEYTGNPDYDTEYNEGKADCTHFLYVIDLINKRMNIKALYEVIKHLMTDERPIKVILYCDTGESNDVANELIGVAEEYGRLDSIVKTTDKSAVYFHLGEYFAEVFGNKSTN